MSEHTNLYGGVTYAQNPFAFDRVFNSHSDVTNPSTDGILIGRYILIQYCDIALTQDDRNLIETWANNGSKPIKYDSLPENVKASWDSYYSNFRKDNSAKISSTTPITELFSWDRHVLRKKYDQGTKTHSYEDIAQLNSTLSIEGLKIHDTLGADPILSINAAKQLTTEFDLGYTNKKLQLIGKDGATPFSEIDTARIVSDHIITTDGYLQWDSTNKAAYIDLSSLSGDTNKIVYMDNEKIKTALTIEYDSNNQSRYYQHIVLKGKDGNVISSFDASNFVKDSFLRSVTCNENNELVFTFKTYDVTTGEYSEVDQSLSLSVDIMDAGDGIQINGNIISIKEDTSSDEFLSVGPNGLLLTGVSTAIETAKQEAISTVENRVYKVNSYAELSEITATKNIGDIGIVITPIAGGKNEYTAYVWQQRIGETEAHWEAMNGNYNAENVYFDEDIVITTQVGNINLTNGQGKIPAQGKNLKQIFESLWTKEDLELSITNPTISLTVSSNASGEVGAPFTRPTATITVTGTGSYEYGSKDAEGNVYSRNDGTGIVFDHLKVGYGASSEEALDSASAYTDTGTSISYTAKDTDISVAKFTDTEQTYYFWGEGGYSDAIRRPVTNLGNFIDNKGLSTTEYNKGQWYIKGTILELGGSNKATWKATGYRNWYVYVGNNLDTINSNFIKGCTSKGNAKNANDISLDIAKGTKRVMIALPTGNLTENSTTITGYNKRLTSCIDVDGMGLDIFNANPSKFVQSVVPVADASGENNMDYIVYVYENVNGLAATTLNVKIG